MHSNDDNPVSSQGEPGGPNGVPPNAVVLQRSTAADRQFLLHLFAMERRQLLERVPCSEPHRVALLEAQFRAFDAECARRFPAAVNWLILEGERKAGHMLVCPESDALRLVEFAILPELRRRGLGLAALRVLQAHAVETGCAVVLRVKRGTNAERLYHRAGFTPTAHEGAFSQLRWLRTKNT